MYGLLVLGYYNNYCNNRFPFRFNSFLLDSAIIIIIIIINSNNNNNNNNDNDNNNNSKFSQFSSKYDIN